MNALRTRFLDLWASLGGKNGDAVWEELAARYSEPTRHYHNFGHIGRCLKVLDKAREHIPSPETVELAIWCHDVIYRPGSPDNEEHSARWLESRGAGMPAVAKAAAIIRATTHCGEPADTDTAYAVDIDLSGLARPSSGFAQDGDKLRHEREDLGFSEYCGCEGRFLSWLLSKPKIYYTRYFYELCETRARENIRRRLKQLENMPGASAKSTRETDCARP